MDPKQIASLICEDEEFVECPSCGSKLAMAVGDRIICTNKKCANYDDGYSNAMNQMHPIEIRDFVNDTHDMTFDGWHRVMTDAAETGNVRGLFIDDEPFLVVWEGPHNIPSERLVAQILREIEESGRSLADVTWSDITL